MNIVWRFFTVASLPVCVLYCLLYCSGPAVSGCAATSLSVVVMDGENPLPGRPGCPGFCSLCLSYRNRPSEPLALFLKKKPAARPRPVHGGHGCAGIPSAASLFGWYTGPLRRPKKGPSLAATPPATFRPLALFARRAGLRQTPTPTSADALSNPGPPGDVVPPSPHNLRATPRRSCCRRTRTTVRARVQSRNTGWRSRGTMESTYTWPGREIRPRRRWAACGRCR